MVRVLRGVILGALLVPLAALAWFEFGSVPVAVADPELPMERWIAHRALHMRIGRERIPAPTVQADETSLVAGAHIYRDQCAACHGFHGKPSSFGAHMFPVAPALWEKHGGGSGVGVSDDPPGETYWKVSNGIRLSGMPAYKSVLNETQMWQVSLLLAQAAKPLPADAVDILRGLAPQASPFAASGALAAKP